MALFGKSPKDDETSLGNLLIMSGVCTDVEVKRAVQYQSDNPEAMLGQVLVMLELVTSEQIEMMLARQRMKRTNGRGKGITQLAMLATQKAHAISGRIDDLLDSGEVRLGKVAEK